MSKKNTPLNKGSKITLPKIEADTVEAIDETNENDDEVEELEPLLPATANSLLDVVNPKTSVKVTEQIDALKAYIKSISRYTLLSPEEEKHLTQELIKTGDIEVAKQLVMANLRLVVKIAMEYRHSYQNILDLIQEGNIGLMKAVSKYNPESGAELSYYASWWIRSYILKFILDNVR